MSHKTLSPEVQKKRQIVSVLTSLSDLPKVGITKQLDLSYLYIGHDQAFVPDFELRWCGVKQHYRVYIWVASTENYKQNAGYCICTVGSRLAAVEFVQMYKTIHKNRANNRSLEPGAASAA